MPFEPSAASAPLTLTPPELAFVMALRVQVGAPLELGQVRGGRRRIVPILGGTFDGPGIAGTILGGGADWQVLHDDGVMDIDARYALRTDRDDLIYIRNAGLRHAAPEIVARLMAGQSVDPSAVYFRSVPTFETGAPDLEPLTRSLHIATGERYPHEVIIRVWRVA